MMTTPEKKPDCAYCEDMQQFASKIGDESYRVDAARQYLAFALIHLINDLGTAHAGGAETVDVAKMIHGLRDVQLGARRAMNAPLPRSRRGDEPVLPQGDPPQRTPEMIALILRVVASKCGELAQIEPAGSHSKRALSDLSLLAAGWITPEDLGYQTT